MTVEDGDGGNSGDNSNYNNNDVYSGDNGDDCDGICT